MEYLASFWNPEAVQKIKEARTSREVHAFPDDESFEQQVLERSYKDNPYVQAIIKLRKERDANNNEDNGGEFSYSGLNLPEDLKFLKDY